MNDQQKTSSEAIAMPEFKSTIPAHLLGKLSDSERYMVETMSKLENQSQWLVDLAIKGRLASDRVGITVQELSDWKDSTSKTMTLTELFVKTTQEKVDKMWDWHLMFSGKWAVVWALLLVAIPLLLKYLVDLALKKGP